MVSNTFGNIPSPGSSLGSWLPRDRQEIKQWLIKKLAQVAANGTIPLDPTIVALQQLVDGDVYLHQLSQEMFTEIPPAYVNDPMGEPQVRNFTVMLQLVNSIIKEGPRWYYKTDPSTAMDFVGFPINAILVWPMATLAGYRFFLHPEVNRKWHDILTTWGNFLTSPASQVCLNEDNGWLSPTAINMLAEKGNNGSTSYSFQQLYACDPNAPYFGFSSWDAFFTRKFNPGIRPVAFPDDPKPAPGQPDPSSIIVNACESVPFQWVRNVSLQDTFWLKGQPYSLYHMLNNDPKTSQFVGGGVYQAYLGTLSFHRWNAPVSGTVVSVEKVAGSYYSENLYQGYMNPDGPDPLAACESQPYISAVATRGIIFILADNPDIGLMAVVFIGMAEVSSCEFTVKANDRVAKGEEIGMFHFGGSSHCVVVRPSTSAQLKFVNPPPWNQNNPNNQAVNSALAVVEKS